MKAKVYSQIWSSQPQGINVPNSSMWVTCFARSSSLLVDLYLLSWGRRLSILNAFSFLCFMGKCIIMKDCNTEWIRFRLRLWICFLNIYVVRFQSNSLVCTLQHLPTARTVTNWLKRYELVNWITAKTHQKQGICRAFWTNMHSYCLCFSSPVNKYRNLDTKAL